MSFQNDGSISIGLSDRAFIAPEFRAQHSIWNYYNRVTVNYVVPDTPHALVPIQNPHFTYHPPLRFHLRADGEPALFEGIQLVGCGLHQQERYEWLRIGSKPVHELSLYRGARSPGSTDIITIPVPGAQCSVGLGVDFVRSAFSNEHGHGLLDICETWHDRKLHIFSELLPLQTVTTLGWFHHY
jgi:hypothetical protein